MDGLVTGVPGANDDVNKDVQLAVSNVIQAPIDTGSDARGKTLCSLFPNILTLALTL